MPCNFVDYGRTYSRRTSDGVRGPTHHYQKEVPLFSSIPIKHAVIQMLHVLLGLGNNLIRYFWRFWFDKRVDYLTPHENTARMMTMMSDSEVTQVEQRHEN